jgi:uncharacterized protein (UPF0210 family)
MCPATALAKIQKLGDYRMDSISVNHPVSTGVLGFSPAMINLPEYEMIASILGRDYIGMVDLTAMPMFSDVGLTLIPTPRDKPRKVERILALSSRP